MDIVISQFSNGKELLKYDKTIYGNPKAEPDNSNKNKEGEQPKINSDNPGKPAEKCKGNTDKIDREIKKLCNFDTDIGTEELAHLEMVAAIVHQLTKNLSMDQIEASGFRNYYVDHTIGIWPQAAGGMPFSAAQFQSTGDIITDLTEDMAADATLMY